MDLDDLLSLSNPGLFLITAERKRQVEVEGYSAKHDEQHGSEVLQKAARCYELSEQKGWPWAPAFWKPKDPLRDLIRAGALYAAARDAQLGKPGYSVQSPSLEVSRIAGKINNLLFGVEVVLTELKES